ARMYDPVLGRFLSRDPLLIPRTAATTNPYAFAMNDPVNMTDPSGRDPEEDPVEVVENPDKMPVKAGGTDTEGPCAGDPYCIAVVADKQPDGATGTSGGATAPQLDIAIQAIGGFPVSSIPGWESGDAADGNGYAPADSLLGKLQRATVLPTPDP